MVYKNLHWLQFVFSKFTPLEDKIYPRLRTTGLRVSHLNKDQGEVSCSFASRTYNWMRGS